MNSHLENFVVAAEKLDMLLFQIFFSFKNHIAQFISAPVLYQESKNDLMICEENFVFLPCSLELYSVTVQAAFWQHTEKGDFFFKLIFFGFVCWI